jgi:hypothetical protein
MIWAPFVSSTEHFWPWNAVLQVEQMRAWTVQLAGMPDHVVVSGPSAAPALPV